MSSKLKFSEFISKTNPEDLQIEENAPQVKPITRKLIKRNLVKEETRPPIPKVEFPEFPIETIDEIVSDNSSSTIEDNSMDQYVKILAHSFKPKEEAKEPEPVQSIEEVVEEKEEDIQEEKVEEKKEEPEKKEKPAGKSRLSSLEASLANIHRHLKKISNAGPGSGEVKLKRLDDVDMSNSHLNNAFLKYDKISKKFFLQELNLSLLSDIDLSNLEDNGYLQYNISTQKWEVTAAASGGLTEEQVEDIVGAMLMQGIGIRLAYNDLAGLLQISLDPTDVVEDIERDVDDNVTTIIRSSGLTKTFTYDTAGDLDTMTINDGVDLYFFQANYDLNGNFSGWSAI